MQEPPLIQLPTYHTALIGRSEESAEIRALLLDPEQRLVTLVGHSGAGKTRLALEVSTALADAFAHGVVFVSLAPVLEAELVLPTIAAAFDLREQSDTSLLDTLTAALADKQMLLVLDNVEQVQAASADLLALLQGTAQLTLLLTSQVALDVAPEYAYVVPPLAFPHAELDTLALDEMREYPAVALFVDRMQVVQPQFQLTSDNVAAVVEICRLVQGFPLAIELVAAHSAALSPADLLVLLRNHLALKPAGGSMASTSRTDVLEPVLSWCYARLPAEAQAVFRRAGIFLGGWFAAAVDPVCAPAADVEPLLALLVAKNLVLEETLPGQKRRYTMLDAVRSYAELLLKRQDEWRAVAARHAQYYRQLVEQIAPSLQGPELRENLRLLDSEVHNIRAALSWLLEQDERETAAHILGELFWFWIQRGYYTEGRQWLEQALRPPVQASHVVLAHAWKTVGVLRYLQGDYDQAYQAYQHSLDAFNHTSDAHGQGAVLNNMGLVAFHRDDLSAARAAYEQSLQLYRQETPINNNSISRGLANLGMVCSAQSDFLRALEYYAEALQLHRQEQNKGLMAVTLNNMAVCKSELGRFDEALELGSEALAISRDIGMVRETAASLSTLGGIELFQGQLSRAEQLYAESATMFADTGQRYDLCIVRSRQGRLLLAQGRLDAAYTLLNEALAGFQKLAATRPTVVAWLALTRLHLLRAEWDQARQTLRQALAVAVPVPIRLALILALEELACLTLHTDAAAPAVRWLALATAARQTLHTPIYPLDQQHISALKTQLQQRLSAEQFAQEWQAGAALDLVATTADVLHAAAMVLE